MNGKAQEFNSSLLPKLPEVPHERRRKKRVLTIGLPIFVVACTVAIAAFITATMVRRKIKFAEILEDWEREYGPQRFSYNDLVVATKGFGDKQLLGAGGFGRVYRGVLPSSKFEVAVKRVSHGSRQGMREFVAEISSIGRLRHRNLVSLLGYCRRKAELLLVYDFMPNGSLDKLLFGRNRMLAWDQRFQIIKGVASGLFYLHEEWEQVVVHRDIKASNVLVDGEMNGRLGDFGLARLYNHGSNPETTRVAGTLGYLAPELCRTGKATTSTDVFAFGVFMLEVACGKRPIDSRASEEDVLLVDWVSNCWRRGAIWETSDPRLGTDYVMEEMVLVLKLGLLCSHPLPIVRPRMRQIMQFLNDDLPLPELSTILSVHGLELGNNDGVDDLALSDATPMFGTCSSVAPSVLSGGR